MKIQSLWLSIMLRSDFCASRLIPSISSSMTSLGLPSNDTDSQNLWTFVLMLSMFPSSEHDTKYSIASSVFDITLLVAVLPIPALPCSVTLNLLPDSSIIQRCRRNCKR